MPDLSIGKYQVSFRIKYRNKANNPESDFKTIAFNYNFSVEWKGLSLFFWDLHVWSLQKVKSRSDENNDFIVPLGANLEISEGSIQKSTVNFFGQ